MRTAGFGRRAAAALVLLLGLVRPAHAADYWVKNGGNDGADGLSLATAWATLGHAADAVGPGDTVHVQDGSYQGFYLDDARARRASRSPSSPRARTSRSPPTTATTPDGINLEGAVARRHRRLRRERPDARRHPRGARRSSSPSATATLGYNGRWGIFTGFVDDFTIEDNETHHSQAEHGIYVSNSGDRPIIRGNLVHDNHANGIHMNGDASQGGDGADLERAGRGQRHLRQRRRRRLRHQHGRRRRQRRPEQPALRQPRERHQPLPHRRRPPARPATWSSTTRSCNAADGRWCVNINDGSTGNTVRNNILYNLPLVPRRDHRSTPRAARASSSDYNSRHEPLQHRRRRHGDRPRRLAGARLRRALVRRHAGRPLRRSRAATSTCSPASPAVDAGTRRRRAGRSISTATRVRSAPASTSAPTSCSSSSAATAASIPGEQCGEPGLALRRPVHDAASSASVRRPPPVCGDGLVCGAETCEDGRRLRRRTDVPGLPVREPGRLHERAHPRGAATDAPRRRRSRSAPRRRRDPRAVDRRSTRRRTACASWSTRAGGGARSTRRFRAAPRGRRHGTRAVYRDPLGSVGGVVRAIVRDRRAREPGALRVVVKARGGSLVLPDAADVRTTLVLGTADECAALVWNGPQGSPPRCRGDARRLVCR